MNIKIKRSIFVLGGIFIVGNLIIFLGLLKGNEWAINYSRPINTTSWTTSEEIIKAFTYGPIILGSSLLLTSIILLAIVFNKWIKDN